jgi:hypothetical protein
MFEPANRRTDDAGGKYYVHPTTGERFDSVTTILDLVDKAALKYWAARLAADMALEHLPQLVASTLVEPCGNTHNRCYQKHGHQATCERCPCGECSNCWHRRLSHKHTLESRRRADEGTEVHGAIHHWITSGGQVINLTDRAKPYFASFLAWVNDYGLHPNGQPGQGDWDQLEVTLLNREHGYAGTSDGAIWLRQGRTPAASTVVQRLALTTGVNADRYLVRVDYKTREKPDELLFADMPLQAVAYERCETAMLADGREFPAQKTAARAVLQLRPDDYSFKLMLTDDDAFAAFCGVVTAYRWINGPGKTAFNIDAWAPTFAGIENLPEPDPPWETGRVAPPPTAEPEVTQPDPFQLHADAAQAKADNARPARRSKRSTPPPDPGPGTGIIASIREFQIDPPDQTKLDEPIPF